jgi:hypothetical protein
MSILPPSEIVQHLTRVAKKFRADPAYMASVLVAYQSQEKLDDSELADRLAIEPDQLPRLALCKRPQSQGNKFAEQIRQIATYTGANQVVLAQIIRQIEVVERLRALPPTIQNEVEEQPLSAPSSLMAAARDRQEEDSEKPDEEEPENNDEE